MPYPFVRRAGVLALAATMLVPQAGALSGVSSWAQEDITAAQQEAAKKLLSILSRRKG